MEPSDLLFVGMGSTAVAHYRCFLPAQELGCDYVGIAGDPPKTLYVTGIVQGESRLPNYLDYKVVILQQPWGPNWETAIRGMQAHGVTVLYEVDDYLHGISQQQDHDFRAAFTKKALRAYEACMRLCDGMIVSTDYIAQQYRKFNRNIYVCRNGIDAARYDLKMPGRRNVHIGWAGATGHRNSMLPWLQAVLKVMEKRVDTAFVSIGENFAEAFVEHVGRWRTLSVPFAAMEQYPSAMTNIDIAIGPASVTPFYMGKSDLRWLEAGALGIPLVGHPLVYGEIQDGHTGFLAATPQQIEEKLLTLVDNHMLRRAVGDNARRVVLNSRTTKQTAPRWLEVADAMVDAVASGNRRRKTLRSSAG